MSMIASATSAPGRIWWVRLGRDAREVAQLLVAHLRQLGDPLLDVVGGERPGDQRPVAGGGRAADPRQRAEGLRRRDRPVRARRPAAGYRRRGRSRPGSSCAAHGSCRRRGRRARCSRASRAAPSGIDQATSGHSSPPAAISSDPPPMSKTASRPDDQPNQRRTARNVSRASSSPGSTPMSTPVRSLHLAQHLVGVARRRGPPRSRTASISSQPLSSATSRAEATKSASASMPARDDRAGLVEVLGEPQRLLVGVGRERGGALVGVDHQQVAGVGTDVEHAQAHGANLPAP